MKAHHFSASKTDLSAHCLYWCRSDVEHSHRPPGQAAARGTAVHLASDCHHKGLPLPKLDVDAAAMWLTLRGWLESNERATHAELPILYDAENDTAAVCEMGAGERDYLNVSPMSIPMKIDLVWEASSPELIYPGAFNFPTLVDIKTGSRSNVSPAAENQQLATNAVALSRLLKTSAIGVGLLFPMKTKAVEDWAPLHADDLDAHAGVLRKRLRMIPGAEPVKGSHCFRCPVGPTRDFASTCPEWQEKTQEGIVV